MSYASLFRTIPDTLSQPIGIAALISLGIHGSLALILPLVPTKSETSELQSPQNVKFTELTPTEQSHLPPGYRPEVTLPPFATQPTVLPPQPPASYPKVVIPQTLIPNSKYPAISSAPNKLNNTYDVPALQKSPNKGTSPRTVTPKTNYKYPVTSSEPNLDYDIPALHQGSKKPPVTHSKQEVTTTPIGPLTPPSTPPSGPYSLVPVQPLPAVPDSSAQNTNSTTPSAPPVPNSPETNALNGYKHNLQDWLQKVRQKYPNAEDKGVFRLQIPTCQQVSDQTIVFWAVLSWVESSEPKKVEKAKKFEKVELLSSTIPTQLESEIKDYVTNLLKQNDNGVDSPEKSNLTNQSFRADIKYKGSQCASSHS